MRTKKTLRAPGAVNVAAGALLLVLPASALALTSGPDGALAANPNPDVLQASIDRTYVAYDRNVDVDGHVSATNAGRRLVLEFEPAGTQTWRTLTSAAVGRSGAFGLHSALVRSGDLRVASAPSTATTDAQSGGVRYVVAPGGAGLAPSRAQRVVVGSRLSLKPHMYSAIAGRSVTVRGHLLPGLSGREVRLMTRSGHDWTTVAKARTGSRGGFRFSYRVAATGSEALRVRFAGDRDNRPTAAPAGELLGLRYSVASWYYDGGNTACGFHAVDGVANKTLPCGTKVTFVYGGRTVVATVDDRGPYVGGRAYDLNENTAHTLGMGGVATVESSI